MPKLEVLIKYFLVLWKSVVDACNTVQIIIYIIFGTIVE